MRKVALAAAVLIALAMVHPASAVPAENGPKPSSCGGTWTSNDTCKFRYRGGGYSVSVSVLFGAGAVQLQTKNPETGARVVLLECAAAGVSAGCGAGSTEGDTDVHPKDGQRMFCVVIGRAQAGLFSCSTG